MCSHPRLKSAPQPRQHLPWMRICAHGMPTNARYANQEGQWEKYTECPRRGRECCAHELQCGAICARQRGPKCSLGTLCGPMARARARTCSSRSRRRRHARPSGAEWSARVAALRTFGQRICERTLAGARSQSSARLKDDSFCARGSFSWSSSSVAAAANAL